MVSPRMLWSGLADGRIGSRYLSVHVLGLHLWDVPAIGVTVMALTNADQGLANRIADDMSSYIWSRRHEFEHRLPGPEDGVAEGLRALAHGQGPVVLADMSDRHGDSTHILQELLARGAQYFVVATIADEPALQDLIHNHRVGDRVVIDVGKHTTELAG